MVGLMDIAPSNRAVETSFGKIEIKGITLNGIVGIIKRYPDAIEIIRKEESLAFNDIADLGLDVVASVLAAGCGYAGDEAAEQRCKELKPEDALMIGEAIIEESFPNGTQSFFVKVSKAMEKVTPKKSKKTPASDTKDSLIK